MIKRAATASNGCFVGGPTPDCLRRTAINGLDDYCGTRCNYNPVGLRIYARQLEFIGVDHAGREWLSREGKALRLVEEHEDGSVYEIIAAEPLYEWLRAKDADRRLTASPPSLFFDDSDDE